MMLQQNVTMSRDKRITKIKPTVGLPFSIILLTVPLRQLLKWPKVREIKSRGIQMSKHYVITEIVLGA
jgi:hypothetical protein